MAEAAAPGIPDMSTSLDLKQAHVTSQWAHDRPLVACRFDPLGRYVFCGAEDAGLHRFALADGAKTSAKTSFPFRDCVKTTSRVRTGECGVRICGI